MLGLEPIVEVSPTEDERISPSFEISINWLNSSYLIFCQ